MLEGRGGGGGKKRDEMKDWVWRGEWRSYMCVWLVRRDGGMDGRIRTSNPVSVDACAICSSR